MNKHITSAINSQFIATGCHSMLGNSSDVDYYHCGTDLYLHYSPELQDEQFYAQSNLTEVVIVVANDDGVAMAIDLQLPCEVVKLQDLPDFLRYRALSEDCCKYRLAKQRYDSADEDFNDAHAEHGHAKNVHKRAVIKFSAVNAKLAIANEQYEQANDIHKAATAAFWSHPKPPRFRQLPI